MGFMTKLDGVPDSDQAIPGMAFFAGAGPVGAVCGDCIHRGYKRESKRGTWNAHLGQMVYRLYRVTKCAMFRKMAGGQHGTDIKKDTPACKFFEAKPKPATEPRP